MTSESDKTDQNWPKVSVSGLEADIAYFEARLSMLQGDSTTVHQEAQARAYQALESTLIGMLLKLRMQSVKEIKNSDDKKSDTETD
ncbi:MAG: hypothetical protein GY753_05410 [Gammaproteobacteria bacterium]|nr:hypothetical protein [Gammaproteobacteria bacterium]